jgi:hypothetical protein
MERKISGLPAFAVADTLTTSPAAALPQASVAERPDVLPPVQEGSIAMMPDFVRRHLLDQMATVERHIVQSEMNVTVQRHRVEAQERSGHDTDFSRSLLAKIETVLRMHYQHRHGILRGRSIPGLFCYILSCGSQFKIEIYLINNLWDKSVVK